MENTFLIAKFMGPPMIAAGFAMLVSRQGMRAVFDDFMESPALIFTAGFMAMLIGLAILIFHNHWVAGWPVIITVYGWMALVAGIVRMVAPGVVRKMGAAFMKNDAMLVIAAVMNMGLGAFLSMMGFFS